MTRTAEPVDEFIQALPYKRAAKINDFIEEYLNGQPAEIPCSEFPTTYEIEGELPEFGSSSPAPVTGYRNLYKRSENLVVLLRALEKDTGAAP